jgi:hypothetical protein
MLAALYDAGLSGATEPEILAHAPDESLTRDESTHALRVLREGGLVDEVLVASTSRFYLTAAGIVLVEQLQLGEPAEHPAIGRYVVRRDVGPRAASTAATPGAPAPEAAAAPASVSDAPVTATMGA